MSLSALLLLIYTIFLFLYILFSWAGIYHLWRFGYTGDLSRVGILVYVIFSVITIITSYIILLFAGVGI